MKGRKPFLLREVSIRSRCLMLGGHPWRLILGLALAISSVADPMLAARSTDDMMQYAPANRKVIIANVGEVTDYVGYVSERVLFRIYYSNDRKETVDLLIADKLDAGLANIAVGAPGEYSAANRVVAWKLRGVPPGASGYVEFSGTLKREGVVRNSAQIRFWIAGRLGAFKIRTYRPESSSKIVPHADLGRLDLAKRPITIETDTVTIKVYRFPRLGWIPFETRAREGSLPAPAMKDNTTIGAMINIDIPGVFVREEKSQGISYQRFHMPGQAEMTALGEPELPIIGQMIEVPHGVDLSIEVIKAREVRLDHYRIYPAQRPLVDVQRGDPLTASPPDAFELSKTRYLANAPFPDALATIQTEDIGIVRGHRIVMLKVNPIQYNPVTHETKAYAQIEVRVRYNRPAQIMPIARRLYSRNVERLLKNLALNYRGPLRFDPALDRDLDRVGKEPTGCEYLILTTSAFYNSTDPNNPVTRLANWKQRKGLRVKIVDTANISNGQTYDGIRQYLKNGYDTWDIVPSYVLLIGDADIIPVRYHTAHDSHNNTLAGTDLYYAALDGDDIYPDLYLGRLSVDVLAEATTAIDRILNYEQQPPNNANFYSSIMFSALFEDIDDPNTLGVNERDGREDRPWIENVEDIRNYVLGLNYQADRIYRTSSGWPVNPARPQPASYKDGTALPAAISPPGFQWNGTAADVRTAINAGRFLATYRDHGDRTSWTATGFNTNDINALANGALAPVVFSIACQTGWFDNETDDDANLAIINATHLVNESTAAAGECFCEHFIRNAADGAVAIFGSTRNSWTGHNDYLMFGMHKALWPAYTPNPPTTGDPAIPAMDSNQLLGMGQIMTFGKLYMARAYSASTIRTLQFEMYHLFGDPEMPMWTSAPSDLAVTHPADIGSAGDQDFVVTVKDRTTQAPLTMARIAITLSNSLLAVRETDPAGIARFTLGAPASGILDITVTRWGYRPYMGTINVTADGASINRLDPDNGIAGQTVHVGGVNFSDAENVDIIFDGALLATAPASNGSFGQQSQTAVDIQVPSPHDLGPVNVVAHGQTSGKYAVDVFQIRSQNPIDLYMYSQWGSDTWWLHPGDNPTWDNPSIQLYDANNNAAASNNLSAGYTYTIKADVRNDTPYPAKGVTVTFKWTGFGIGQPDQAWTLIDQVEVDVPAQSVVQAQVKWTTPATGHLCVLAQIYHIEDINPDNNNGQENCHVGPTSSPARIPFTIWNPTKEPAMVYLDLRQLIDATAQIRPRLWGSYIIHPDPQLLRPGESREATVVIDPDMIKDVKSGEETEYSLTGFINGKTIGGVNFKIKKR